MFLAGVSVGGGGDALVYLLWLDFRMFYYVEFIQITNGNLSKLNIVVLINSCVLLNSSLLNLILAMCCLT